MKEKSPEKLPKTRGIDGRKSHSVALKEFRDQFRGPGKEANRLAAYHDALKADEAYDRKQARKAARSKKKAS